MMTIMSTETPAIQPATIPIVARFIEAVKTERHGNENQSRVFRGQDFTH